MMCDIFTNIYISYEISWFVLCRCLCTSHHTDERSSIWHICRPNVSLFIIRKLKIESFLSYLYLVLGRLYILSSFFIDDMIWYVFFRLNIFQSQLCLLRYWFVSQKSIAWLEWFVRTLKFHSNEIVLWHHSNACIDEIYQSLGFWEIPSICFHSMVLMSCFACLFYLLLHNTKAHWHITICQKDTFFACTAHDSFLTR